MERIPNYVWVIGTLVLWGAAILFLGLVRFTPLALDEGAAQALLLNWSVADLIVSPVLTLGLTDLRALLFVPLGVYWTGSIFAAKVYAIITLFIGILALYRWSREQFNDEVALMASGLMMVAPLSLLQLDNLGIGIFILAMFGLGMWANNKYRAQKERAITGWYFVQNLLVAIAVTLHPMGLAYPLALAWQWYRQPDSGSAKHRQTVFIGLAVTVGIMFAMQAGWVDLHWYADPVSALADISYRFNPSDTIPDQRVLGGSLMFLLLIPSCFYLLRQSGGSLMANMLGLATLIGLICADAAWALVAQAVILYAGLALLIKLNHKLPVNSFMGQRGLTMTLVFVCLFWFMQMDKNHAQYISSNILSPTDQLIEQISVIARDDKKLFRAATQWPGRTMIAARRDALPLPEKIRVGEIIRNIENGEELEKQTKGVITHFMFNHSDPQNSALSRNLSQMAHITETLVLEEGGVIIAYREIPDMELPPPPETAEQASGEAKPAPAKQSESDAPVVPMESEQAVTQ